MGDNSSRTVFVVCCQTLEMEAGVWCNWLGKADPQSINKIINAKFNQDYNDIGAMRN